MESIQSVLMQSYQNWELVIIDDGSSDATAKKVEEIKDDRIRYFYLDKCGRSAARNFGIKVSSGDYVLFLDDDDLILPHHLAVFDRAIEKNDSTELTLYRTGFLKKENNELQVTKNYDQHQDSSPLLFLAHNMGGVGSLCIPRSCLKEHLFPEQFSYWEDTHLFLRLVAHYEFIQLNEYTYIYRIHSRMGSKVVVEEDIYRVAQENIAAMNHLFENYADELASLTPQIRDYLVQEKKLQYVLMAQENGLADQANKLMKDLPLVDLRFWKYYLKIWVGVVGLKLSRNNIG